MTAKYKIGGTVRVKENGHTSDWRKLKGKIGRIVRVGSHDRENGNYFKFYIKDIGAKLDLGIRIRISR